jgi:hypothetical protein
MQRIKTSLLMATFYEQPILATSRRNIVMSGMRRTRQPDQPAAEGLIGGSGKPMTTRTKVETVSFLHPFKLDGIDDVQPPGRYVVETDDEEIDGLSLPVYRRLSMVIHIGGTPGTSETARAVPLDPAELAAARASDARPRDMAPAATADVSITDNGRRHPTWIGPFSRRATGRLAGMKWDCRRKSR